MDHDVVKLAAEFVRIPSVNPAGQEVRNSTFGEAATAGRVKTLLRTLGATDVQTTYPLSGRPNVTGYFDFGAAQTVIFEAHLDTVPTDGMTIDPFAAEVQDGRLWGRGACDVKGPMAAMLATIAEVKERGSARYNVLFAAVCDEEAGFSGVRHFLQHLPSVPAPLAFAIIAEPTDLQPVAAHKGVVRWHVISRGIAAHSSTPELGRNAIYQMADALGILRDHADELRCRSPHVKLGAPSLNVGTISGGTAANVVPELCTAHVDRRLIPGELVDAALEELRTLLRPLPHIEVSAATVAAPAFEVADDSPAVLACIAAARSIGVTSAPQYANYCTDASFYPAHNIPAIVFGPGSIRQAHTADEFIEIEALRQGVKAYASILSN